MVDTACKAFPPAYILPEKPLCNAACMVTNMTLLQAGQPPATRPLLPSIHALNHSYARSRVGSRGEMFPHTWMTLQPADSRSATSSRRARASW